MYAIFTMRKTALTQRINDIQLKLMELSQRAVDLAQFGTNAQDGIISPDEFASSPSSIFMYQLGFNNQAIGMTLPNAFAKYQMAMMQQAFMQQQGIYNYAPMSNFGLFSGILKNELESYSRQLTKKIKVEETKIQQEKDRLNMLLKTAQSELETVSKAEEDGIKRAAPQYV